MSLRAEATTLPEVLLITPVVHADARGRFAEAFHAEKYRAVGVNARFYQDNVSYSRRGVLRGLHFQDPYPQGKLVQVLEGEVFDVAVDMRRDSPRFRQWTGVTLDSRTLRQLWIPPGFAHGFLSMSDVAIVSYKCTAPYEPMAERTVRWNDPDIGIDWPQTPMHLSDKDAAAPLLREL